MNNLFILTTALVAALLASVCKQYIECNIQYIVIHGTDNASANAEQHKVYFSKPTTTAKVHFVIDDKQILPLLPIKQRGVHVACKNNNTIGIELCEFIGVDKEDEITNLKKLLFKLKQVLPYATIAFHGDFECGHESCPKSLSYDERADIVDYWNKLYINPFIKFANYLYVYAPIIK